MGIGTTGASPLTMRSVRGMYFERLTEEFNSLWVPMLAVKQTSDQPFEEYAMLGAVPKMVKWEGERTVTALRGSTMVLINDDWTTGFSIRRKDLRRDKSEQIRTRAGELASVVAHHPEELITQLLVANGTAYDGVAYFHASSHVTGDSGIVKNALGTGDGLAGAAAPTSAQMAANILIGYQTFLGFKNDQGHPVNQNVRRIAVMVPVNMIAAAYGAIDLIFTSAGVSNPLKAIKGLELEVIVNPRLTATNKFYMFALSAGYQPLLWQEEWNEPEELGPNSEHAIKTNECQFNHGWTGAVGYGEFKKALQLTTS